MELGDDATTATTLPPSNQEEPEPPSNEHVFRVRVRAAGAPPRGIPVPVSDLEEAGTVVDFVGDALGGVERELSKLIHKGKQLSLTVPLRDQGVSHDDVILLISSKRADIERVQGAKPDCLVRSFEQEDELIARRLAGQAGEEEQDHKFRFCRFNTIPRFTTPHPFEAERLLRRLATDPGIKHVMKKYKFTVGELNEMDPRDDRLAQKKEAEGACLLGYNENAGARIYLRLRTDDELSFRGYEGIVNTLLHELTHNVRGPHDEEFWKIFGQLKHDYLAFHAAEKGQRASSSSSSATSSAALAQARVQRTVQNQLRNQMGNQALSAGERAGVAAALRSSASTSSSSSSSTFRETIPSGPRPVVPALGATHSRARMDARAKMADAAERRFKAAEAAQATTVPTKTAPEPTSKLPRPTHDHDHLHLHFPPETLSTLRRVVENVLSNPHDDKFKRLRTSNERVSKLLATPGVRPFLTAEVGFVSVADASDGGAETLVLPSPVDAAKLRQALTKLESGGSCCC